MLLRAAARSAALRARAPALGRALAAPQLSRVAAVPLFRERRDGLSSAPAPAPRTAGVKMGELSVDKLAGSSTVQGVEYVLTGLDRLVNWARKSSMWPMTFGLA